DTISAARGHWCTWPSSRARCARSARTRAGRAATWRTSVPDMARAPLYRSRSAAITEGPHRAGARAMLKAVVFDDEALKKPLVGGAHTSIEIGPPNYPP